MKKKFLCFFGHFQSKVQNQSNLPPTLPSNPPPFIPSPPEPPEPHEPPPPVLPSPPPPEVPQPPPPSDVHEHCVPVAVFRQFEKDYQALEHRFRVTEAENKKLKREVNHYKTIVNEQQAGKVPKQVSDTIFKERLKPFLSETQSNMWVNNLKRPRQWSNEDYNLSEEINGLVSTKGFNAVRAHLPMPCKSALQKKFSWLSIVPGIVKPIASLVLFLQQQPNWQEKHRLVEEAFDEMKVSNLAMLDSRLECLSGPSDQAFLGM